MQRFLTFIVEGVLASGDSSEKLKESVVGVAVFDRDAGYDPRSDPVVRVEARRLRAKLEEYYDGLGKEDRIRIDLPKGSYVPVWHWQGEAAREMEAGDIDHARTRSWRRPAIIALSVLAGLAIFLAINEWRSRRFDRGPAAGASPKIRSVAVLPFQNLTADASQEYLIDGLTDEITTDLAKIRTLKVISRTSAQCYRATRKNLPEIARELKVDAIVEGTVLSSQNRVRVTAQLIRAATDSHLWAETYERDASDMFALQAEIAGNIARRIGATVIPVSEREASERPVHPEAYQDYLRGRYLWNKRTLDGIEKSIVFYQHAIQLDPDYGKAYAALGDSYALLSSYGGPAPDDAFTRARQLADQALRLDSSLAEAHTVLAAVKVGYEWDWQGAVREYQRALELNPNYPTAHHWYSLLLSRLGRYREAELQIQRALDLDPLSLIINTDAGEIFFISRKPEQALAHLRRVLELDPQFAEVHLVLGEVYEEKGDWAQAVAEFERAEKLFNGAPNIVALKGHALGLAGRREEALQVVKGLEETATHRYVSPVDIAIAYCGLRQCDRVMKNLEDAYRRRGKGLDIIGTDPLFDPCHSEPQFQALLQKLRLVQPK